ncbi:MAG: carbohydrate kinase, YjeF related protein [Chthonomonadaceae bacterium]|nr:carbohydrate kinase, YjeF related protein [Chthonomonadaceae bacterium]
MQVVTAQQMRDRDRRASEEFGIPSVVLMENAGRAVVDAVTRECGPVYGKRAVVFCGPGNNGGDGFVIARYLHLAGVDCTLLFVGQAEGLKADARVHYDLARRLDLKFLPADQAAARDALLTRVDFVVDALLGTGVKSAPRAEIAAQIEAINTVSCPVFAVDIPSGVDADTGATPGAAVRATHTVTFAYPKLGLLLFPGAEHVGKLDIADIGFDWGKIPPTDPAEPTIRVQFALDADTFPRDSEGALSRGPARPHGDFRGLASGGRFDFGKANRLLRKRKGETNKGDYGHVGVVAGSRGMAGAPSLVARGAQRVGTGLVTVLAPAGVQPTIGAKLDEQMTIALPEKDGAVSGEAFAEVSRFAEKATVLCVGPGLTTEPEASALVRRLVVEIPKPLVLDADGLNALAKSPEMALARPDDPRAPLVLTPHPGEAARLLGTSIADVQSNRIESARELARRYRATVVLKGRHSLTADSQGNIVLNTSGNPGMASGGMGDTLTGILGGLLAQAIAPLRANEDENTFRTEAILPLEVVALGVFLHGLAGDLAAAAHGEAGLVAGDLIDHLPAAHRLLEEML